MPAPGHISSPYKRIIASNKMLSFILTLFLTFPGATSQELPKGPMQPLSNEKLKQSISLQDRCKNVNIVEWLESTSKGSYRSQQSIKIISDTCNLAVTKFFVETKIKSNHDLIQNISILPEDSAYRHLNDAASRFYYRSAQYENGQIIPILGYHQRAANHIFIFNEILLKDKKDNWTANPEFKKILAHEIYHALSFQFGLFAKRGLKKDEKEEAAAQKFANHYKW